MSFVMIATGPPSRSRVRTLSMRRLGVAGAAAAALLLAAGAGLGQWAGRWAATNAATAAAGAARSPSAPAQPFTVEQLGALSGRLFQLESQALQLGQRLGTAPMAGLAAGQVARQAAGPSPGSSLGSAAPPRPQAEAGPPARPRPPASGGPLLPPRPEADMSDAAGVADEGGALGLLQDRLARVAQQLARVADAATLQRLALMRLPTRLPVAGAELTSGFGNREDPLTGQRAFHDGLDLAVARGTVIRAAAGGRVVYAGLKPDFGRMVEIDHGNGLATLYAHASRLLVTAGAVVLPGDPIAEVGSSGRSTGPHLHFEVLRQGTAIDPRRYLAGL